MCHSIRSITLSVFLLTALLLMLLGSASPHKSLAVNKSSLKLEPEKPATPVSLTTALTEELAEKEILLATKKVPRFHVVDLPVRGQKFLTFTDSLTVDDLRNVKIDDDPPQWVGPGNITEMKDEPFVATDIEPFQLKYFTITWDYRGPYYTGKASMYAALHGFNTIFPHLVVTSTQNPTGVYVTELTRVPITPLTGLLWQGFAWNRNDLNNPKAEGFWQVVNVAPGRFDMLSDRFPNRAPLVQVLLKAASQLSLTKRTEPTYTNYDYLILDIEDPTIPLNLSQLCAPGSGFTCTGPEFAAKYYRGFANAILAVAEVAGKQGWPLVGIYGWRPAQRAFDELEPEPYSNYYTRTIDGWKAYGQSIYLDNAIDFINVSVYPMAWNDPAKSNKNNLVAYTLANTDLNIKLGKELAQQAGVTAKPVLTWFWHLIFRQFDLNNPLESSVAWWREQPIRNEDATAMIAMNFFTGADGLVLWNWSPTIGYSETISSYTETTVALDVVTIRTKWDYTVKSDFTLPPPKIAPTPLITPCTQVVTEVKRYDAIHILKIDAGKNEAWFQWIQKYCEYSSPDHILLPEVRFGVNFNWKPGDSEAKLTYPVYVMKVDELAKHLRPRSSSVAGVIEGLAVVKPFEYSLRHGSVMLDFPAVTDVTNQCWYWNEWWLSKLKEYYNLGIRDSSPAVTQFQCRLPIVRRIKIGNYHILITYDPRWEEFKNSPRQIVLQEFDGKPLRLILPADQKTRIFVLRDAAVDLAPGDFGQVCWSTYEDKLLGAGRRDFCGVVFSVKNQGNITAPTSKTMIAFSDSYSNREFHTPEIPPGASVEFRLGAPIKDFDRFRLYGHQAYTITTDYDNQVHESNENNNIIAGACDGVCIPPIDIQIPIGR